jgi:Icc-related predicted phosphoesterase
MKLHFFSDTHNKHDQLKFNGGDILFFCGDMCKSGKIIEAKNFIDYVKNLPYLHKVVIAGNHDFCFEDHNKEEIENYIKESGIIYLNDSGIELLGLKIWGSPIQPTFFDWAFNRDRGEPIRQHWDLIPHDTQILLTHGPPQGIFDKVARGPNVGCFDLLQKIKLIKPKIHAFGHIHEDRGHMKIGDTHFINACNLDLKYQVRFPVIEIDL